VENKDKNGKNRKIVAKREERRTKKRLKKEGLKMKGRIKKG
jgi:hypothetical protein